MFFQEVVMKRVYFSNTIQDFEEKDFTPPPLSYLLLFTYIDTK